MAKRERFNVVFKCENCGYEGRMYAEENESLLTGRDLTILRVMEGFTVKGLTITCDK